MAADEKINPELTASSVTPASLRVDKNIARDLVVSMAPQYLELFRELQRPEGWRKVASSFGEMRTRLKLDSYVLLYEDERRINASLALAFWDIATLKELEQELQKATDAERQQFVDEWAGELLKGDIMDTMFPDDEEGKARQQAQFNALSESEKQEAIKRMQHLASFSMGFFYNMLSVMVHGERLTGLVGKALKGDRVAFSKAIHIDKFLLQGHPIFRAEFEKAQAEPRGAFLADIARRLQASPTKGRVRYPGVYCVFAMLEALNWLDGFSGEEVLDICDAAGLDRWENRIEDVNYLTKRRLSYRRMQKLGGLSMH